MTIDMRKVNGLTAAFLFFLLVAYKRQVVPPDGKDCVG
jgi:hypothetical protein